MLRPARVFGASRLLWRPHGLLLGTWLARHGRLAGGGLAWLGLHGWSGPGAGGGRLVAQDALVFRDGLGGVGGRAALIQVLLRHLRLSSFPLFRLRENLVQRLLRLQLLLAPVDVLVQSFVKLLVVFAGFDVG